MRLRGLVTIILMTVSAATAVGQSIVVSNTDEEKFELDLSGLVEVTSEDSVIVARYENGKNETHTLSEVSRLDFSDATGMDMISAMDGKVAYSGSDGLIFVADSKGEHLLLYSLGGTQVLDKKIESQLETIEISSLSKGIYLMKLEGKTIKIVR